MKNIIRQNFDRASNTYSKYDDVQQQSASDLVKQMMGVCPKLNPHKILDIGCGTGNLIKELYHFFPEANYHINDISTSMLEETSRRFENIIDFEIIYGCIEQAKLCHHYDLIASNMCLQWVDDLNSVIDNLLSHTKLLVFSCLLKDSFQEWYDLLEQHGIKHASRLYPLQKEIHTLISRLNNHILYESQNTHSIAFHSAKESVKYLKNIGANAPKYSIRDSGKVSSFLRAHNKVCNLQYNIGFFIIEGRL